LVQAATPQVTPQVETALLFFCIGPRSAQEILKKLRLKDRKSFFAVYLRPMLGAGFLERTIPEKPQSRLQRYRTTAAGKARLPSVVTGRASEPVGVKVSVAPPKSPGSRRR
jgi:hypothetical protein